MAAATLLWREDPAKGCEGLEAPLTGLTYACPEGLADLWTLASHGEAFTLAFPPGTLQELPPGKAGAYGGCRVKPPRGKGVGRGSPGQGTMGSQGLGNPHGNQGSLPRLQEGEAPGPSPSAPPMAPGPAPW